MAERVRLTDARARALVLPAGTKDITYYDDRLPGFGLRLRAGSRRGPTWVLCYKVGRRTKREPLGLLAYTSAKVARARAEGARQKVNQGGDPQGERAARRAAPLPMTLGDLVARYVPLVVEQEQQPRSQVETRRYLERYWQPLHRLPLAEVSRRDVAARLTRLAQERGRATANRARAALSAAFTWAMTEGLSESNPVAATRKLPERPRERVLTDAELVAVWDAAGEGDYGVIVRLLMLTAQRREEVGALRWSELDLKGRRWSLPGERTKNRRPHEVPLSEQALALLAALPQREGRELVFGTGARGFAGWSQCKTRLDRRCGFSVWTLHDLRRTAATRMNELELADPHVVEAVLNHASGHRAGIAGVYNRAAYADGKRRALQRWADHLDRLRGVSAGAEVVALRG